MERVTGIGKTVWSAFPRDTKYFEPSRFAWAMDPEGNRIELWEPPE